MKQKQSFAAEQREEARAGVADGLQAGATLKDVTREAAAYGVKPEEVAAIRGQVEREEGRRAADIIDEMTPEERVRGFQALLGGHQNGNIWLEIADGDYRLWGDLSPADKLGIIASDAAYYGVPFEAFVTAAKEHIGADALLDASLRVALDNQRELRQIDLSLPDDGRTEPTPLVDQVKNLVADLAHAERFSRRQPSPEQELDR